MTVIGAEVRLVPVRNTEQVAMCEEIWSEYGDWATGEYRCLTGRQVQPDHEGFRDNLPDLMAGDGRLYLVESAGVPVATGGLKLTAPEFAEIKRMYVRPAARRRGISRTLLGQLIEDASEYGYDRVRLDTMVFMTAALSLYRSMGFVDVDPYDQSESARAGIASDAVYLELTIGRGVSPATKRETV